MARKSEKSNSTAEQLNDFSISDTIKIGKDIYIIERHFSGERDVLEAVFTAVKNEAFRAS